MKLNFCVTMAERATTDSVWRGIMKLPER